MVTRRACNRDEVSSIWCPQFAMSPLAIRPTFSNILSNKFVKVSIQMESHHSSLQCQISTVI